MKILLIGDTADNNYTLKKFSKNDKIHLINFPRKEDGLKTLSNEGVEFFDSLLLSKQVKKIQSIKDDFDVCLVLGWAAARVAYLSGLNYIMYFVGNDIVTPPFVKNVTEEYLNEPVSNYNSLERKFYRKIFDSAIACIAVNSHYHRHLKKFRTDAIRMDRIFVDNELFNDKILPIDLPKKKFTFLSPQRISIEKGFDLISEALKLTKTDFEVLQVEWFIERTKEEKEFNKKFLKNLPTQMKLIPLIPRKKLGSYYKFADAILGQFRYGSQGAIERDAAMCNVPVVNYNDPEKTMIIDGKEVLPPFLPDSNKPIKIAEIIDEVVRSKDFREELARNEFEYVMKLSLPETVMRDWEKIFKKIYEEYPTINRKSSKLKLKIENMICNTLERLIYTKKFQQKNINAWGKEEYERLSK